MSVRRLLPAVLLLALACAGCGDGDTAGARVKVVTSAPDGAVEGEVKLQSLDDGEGRLYATRALDGGVYLAPGAPPGKYRLLSTAGWGMLWTGRQGTSAPLLRGADYPPTVVRMGKPRSLYVASGQPGRWTVSSTWGAEWKPASAGDGAPYETAPLRVEDQGEGIMALRFTPEVWRSGNLVRIVGLFTDGTVTGMQSYQMRDPNYPELPRMALMLGAVQAPLAVHVVPPPGMGEVPDGTLVRAALRDVALKHAYEARTFRGTARFEEAAALGHGLRVALPGSGPETAFDLDSEAWRTRGAMHVVAVQPGQLAGITVSAPPTGFVEARVRYRGGTAFGRVVLEALPAESDATERVYAVRTHPGWQEWWLRTSDHRWFHVFADVPALPEEAFIFPGEDSLAGCRARGQVRGAGLGYRVLFQLQLEPYEDEGQVLFPAREVGGEGFEAAVSFQGSYEARLPPGRYRIQVVGPSGSGGRPKVMEFRPGSQVLLDLEAR